jgi:hypothetical protein
VKLTAYSLEGDLLPIEAGRISRDWMDEMAHRFPKRCLPMLIANQHGWMVCLRERVKVAWSGFPEKMAMATVGPVMSHFGNGIVTFRIPYLFRTEPGWNLWVKGPSNVVKRYVHPLEGIVETDQTAATFTMNWKFDSPGHAIWEPGEPICMICPVPRMLESVEPEIVPIAENSDLARRYEIFRQRRMEDNQAVDDGPKVNPQISLDNPVTPPDSPWSREYHKGRDPDGTVFEEHSHRLRLKEFR